MSLQDTTHELQQIVNTTTENMQHTQAGTEQRQTRAERITSLREQLGHIITELDNLQVESKSDSHTVYVESSSLVQSGYKIAAMGIRPAHANIIVGSLRRANGLDANGYPDSGTARGHASLGEVVAGLDSVAKTLSTVTGTLEAAAEAATNAAEHIAAGHVDTQTAIHQIGTYAAQAALDVHTE